MDSSGGGDLRRVLAGSQRCRSSPAATAINLSATSLKIRCGEDCACTYALQQLLAAAATALTLDAPAEDILHFVRCCIRRCWWRISRHWRRSRLRHRWRHCHLRLTLTLTLTLSSRPIRLGMTVSLGLDHQSLLLFSDNRKQRFVLLLFRIWLLCLG